MLYHGDCLDILRTLPEASVDAVVTDPPAGIAFMGKSWDTDKGGRDAWIAWLAEVMSEVCRVMKPGAHALVWSLPRTSHWTGMALEDAGLEPRDAIAHMFGSGFPKSHNISAAIDKASGAKRETIATVRKTHIGGTREHANTGWQRPSHYDADGSVKRYMDITAPATDAARQWEGFGTSLKPSMELWWLCRKPLAEGTIAGQVLATGTGALNIGACRVGDETTRTHMKDMTPFHGNKWGMPGVKTEMTGYKENPPGRWPPNALFSHSLFCAPDACSPDCPIRVMGEQAGIRKSGGRNSPKGQCKVRQACYGAWNGRHEDYDLAPTVGTAARFFPNFAPDLDDIAPFYYVAKASRSERNAGCDGLPERQAASAVGMQKVTARNWGDENERTYERKTVHTNSHPTVKPLALMSWLVRLITPPGGVVLDPFMGSGSTGVAAIRDGFGFIGIEREADYLAIAEARIEHARHDAPKKPVLAAKAKRPPVQETGVARLWEAS